MLACVACTVLTSCRTHSAGGVNPQVAMSPDTRSETNMELVPIGERISYTLSTYTSEGKRLLRGLSRDEAVAVALTKAADQYNCDRLIDARWVPEMKGSRVKSVTVTGRPAVQRQKAMPQQIQATSSESQLVYHVVQEGDTLAKIAKRYKVTVGQIVKWNNLTSTELLVGKKLLLQLE